MGLVNSGKEGGREGWKRERILNGQKLEMYEAVTIIWYFGYIFQRGGSIPSVEEVSLFFETK